MNLNLNQVEILLTGEVGDQTAALRALEALFAHPALDLRPEPHALNLPTLNPGLSHQHFK